MSEVIIRTAGIAGRITLNRPKALNAVTYDMVRAIDEALDMWRDDDSVERIIIDAVGDKAFSAGGDIAALYTTGKAGDFGFGQTFWRDEYRMNAKIATYPKPIISFLQGFTMGGGMGVGCHGSHRIVGETSQIAMPECGIGLVPDVGGSIILANAPGHLGEYLGTIGARMNAGDAIFAGFADMYIAQKHWAALVQSLENAAPLSVLDDARETVKTGPLQAQYDDINQYFNGADISEIIANLGRDNSDFATGALKILRRGSPISMACFVAMTRQLRGETDIRIALELEYRFTCRSIQHGDFLEGVRAAIIDKDRAPKWRNTFNEITPELANTMVDKMLAPMGENTLTF